MNIPTEPVVTNPDETSQPLETLAQTFKKRSILVTKFPVLYSVWGSSMISIRLEDKTKRGIWSRLAPGHVFKNIKVLSWACVCGEQDWQWV